MPLARGGNQAHHVIDDLRVYGDLLRHFLQAGDLVAAEGDGVVLFGLQQIVVRAVDDGLYHGFFILGTWVINHHFEHKAV